MLKPTRNPTLQTVARSLREVRLLWSKPSIGGGMLSDPAIRWKLPDPKRDNGHGQVAEVGRDEQSKLPKQSTPAKRGEA